MCTFSVAYNHNYHSSVFLASHWLRNRYKYTDVTHPFVCHTITHYMPAGDVLHVYRDCDDDLPECLTEQLRLYDEKLSSDEEQMVMPGGVDITSHEDLFRALLEKASTYHDTRHRCSSACTHSLVTLTVL